MKKKDRIGLALSGGGYRAATYHIGTLRALRKLHVLDKIDVISTNSGGSITGACYSLYHDDYNKFEQKILNGVEKSVIGKVLVHPRFLTPIVLLLGTIGVSIYMLFSSYAWINLIIWFLLIMLLVFAQFIVLPLSAIIENIYNQIFFNHKTLSELSTKFQTTFNSTNLETGRIFHFSRTKMGDSTYQYREGLDSVIFKPKAFPIARSVMASSCVPFAFTPVKISKEYYYNKDHFKDVYPRLVDGGVYDNQGIHKLTFSTSSSYCGNVIISDAGTELPFKNTYRNVVSLLIRTSDVFMNRIKNFQMMDNIYSIPTEQSPNVAYQSLGFNPKNSMEEFMKMLKNGYLKPEVIEAHEIPNQLIVDENWSEVEIFISKKIALENILNQGCNPSELRIARSIGTNLTPLKKRQSKALIKHAEVITELQVKLFLPHILK